MVSVAKVYFNSLPTEYFWSSADSFQNQLFRRFLSGVPSECQTVWNQIRRDVFSGLIWVQTVCKGYRQTTLGGKDLTNLSRMESLLFINRNSPAKFECEIEFDIRYSTFDLNVGFNLIFDIRHSI